jgi:hypothetical protein
MKKILILTGLLGVAAAAILLTRQKAPAVADPATLHEGVLATGWQPREVFQKALRRRPSTDDKILHAERREWTKDAANGVSRWQWFLAVEPGAALKTWLREQNPFSLQPATAEALKKTTGAPAWFPRESADFEILAGGSTGSLVFLRSRDGKTIYATSSGEGFGPGAPQPPATPSPAIETIAAGRLPNAPPPNPSQP